VKTATGSSLSAPNRAMPCAERHVWRHQYLPNELLVAASVPRRASCTLIGQSVRNRRAVSGATIALYIWLDV
jgi:hypothetical protein